MNLDETEPLTKLQVCLKDIKAWMSTNLLPLNSDKMDVIAFGRKHLWESDDDGER